MKEELYGLANHIAGAKGGLPQDWQDWANEIEMDLRKLANREAQPVPTGKFAGYGLYHAERWFLVERSHSKLVASKGQKVVLLYPAPPAPAVPDDVRHLKNVQELYHSQEERLFALAQRIKGSSFDKYSHSTAQAIDVLEREIFGDDGDACRAAMLAQPVSSGYTLPEGCKLVPAEPTAEMINAALASGALSIRTVYRVMLAAAPEGGN
ncbi:hypothetical protein [Serratia marcescens]|uniref:hypothetical protein n=1 Tax=Serratia marcescens TaxID=615 RepID=UPI00074509DA|nr:hypothetical protein [Serratia marcescens]CVA03049.1 Uncharacterised protein [Serratia marcescens]